MFDDDDDEICEQCDGTGIKFGIECMICDGTGDGTIARRILDQIWAEDEYEHEHEMELTEPDLYWEDGNENT